MVVLFALVVHVVLDVILDVNLDVDLEVDLEVDLCICYKGAFKYYVSGFEGGGLNQKAETAEGGSESKC